VTEPSRRFEKAGGRPPFPLVRADDAEHVVEMQVSWRAYELPA
jgi:hypothetical protein